MKCYLLFQNWTEIFETLYLNICARLIVHLNRSTAANHNNIATVHIITKGDNIMLLL